MRCGMQVPHACLDVATSIMTVANMSFAARNEETYHCSVGYHPESLSPSSLGRARRGLG